MLPNDTETLESTKLNQFSLAFWPQKKLEQQNSIMTLVKYIKHKYTQTQIYRYQNLFGVFNINIRASKVTECLYYLI